MFLLLATAAATASATLPLPADSRVPREKASAAAPNAPRGLDPRAVAIAAPEIEMALLDVKQGPVLRVGALGGRHGAAPKLAHIAVGWRF